MLLAKKVLQLACSDRSDQKSPTAALSTLFLPLTCRPCSDLRATGTSNDYSSTADVRLA